MNKYDGTAHRDCNQFPFGPYADIGYCLDATRWIPRGSATWTVGRHLDASVAIDRETMQSNADAAELEARLYREATA